MVMIYASIPGVEIYPDRMDTGNTWLDIVHPDGDWSVTINIIKHNQVVMYGPTTGDMDDEPVGNYISLDTVLRRLLTDPFFSNQDEL